MGILVLFLIFVEVKCLSFHHCYNISCGFVFYGLYYVDIHFFYIFFGKILIKKWMLIFPNAFCAFMERTIWFLSFILLIWCITVVALHMLNHPCNPGMNPTWSCCMILLCIVAFSLLIFCWGFLHLYSSRIMACNFIFLYCLCQILVIWGWGFTEKKLGMFLSF